jgi:hypothetical protein
VSSAHIQRPELRGYLHNELGTGLHPAVTVFDGERFAPVHDFE